MKKILAVFLTGIFLLGVTGVALASTAAEATALVDKAIAFYKANGKDKAFAEFNNPKGSSSRATSTSLSGTSMG